MSVRKKLRSGCLWAIFRLLGRGRGDDGDGRGWKGPDQGQDGSKVQFNAGPGHVVEVEGKDISD